MTDPQIDSNNFRHRVTHQTVTETANSVNQLVPTVVDGATYWAFVKPLNGREKIIAQQYAERVDYEVTMRYIDSDPFSPRDRLLWGSTVLEIEAVINVDNRGWVQKLYCTSGGPQP